MDFNMTKHKQIVYPSFIPRIFSTTLDMALLSLVSVPIMNIVREQFIIHKFKSYMINHGINMQDSSAVVGIMSSPEFQQTLTAGHILSYIAFIASVQVLLMAVYFIYFWHVKGWTPGKYIAGMRVVDAETFEKPTLWQAIKRFMGVSLFLAGVWFMFFTKNNRALHDKIAGTAVIKR
jgi:uncharacterized RDD family membrane protein YckC